MRTAEEVRRCLFRPPLVASAGLCLSLAHRNKPERSSRGISCFPASTRRAAWSRRMRRVGVRRLLERRAAAAAIVAETRLGFRVHPRANALQLASLQRKSVPCPTAISTASLLLLPHLIFGCFIHTAGAFVAPPHSGSGVHQRSFPSCAQQNICIIFRTDCSVG
jgi:hypothetical protein